MSIIYFLCVLRSKIEEGLKRLREVKPAGETYMHEGIKEVSAATALQLFTDNPTLVKLGSDEMFVVCLNSKASAQIQKQEVMSSSIILALTDGKLEVYVHELTVKEVSFISSNSWMRWILFHSVFFFLFQPVVHLSQAEEARKYGARVYCVGIKDFDEQQVREL